MTTNKASSPTDTGTSDDLRAEYVLDYARSRSNRFPSETSGTVVAVAPEPDVAAVFDTSEAVNRQLRAVMAAGGTDKLDGSGSRRSRQTD